MQNMVPVMELSPHAFYNMGEEDLRSQFLVQLNGVFKGQASGETFNFQGKTDILIRVDGKNVFIAECTLNTELNSWEVFGTASSRQGRDGIVLQLHRYTSGSRSKSCSAS